MALYLVQHGVSAVKTADPQKGLTDQGRNETKLIGDVARNYNIHVGRIVHSGKKRAEQTAEILHSLLKPDDLPLVIDSINPMDSIHHFAATIDPLADTMVVGHLPYLQRLLDYLTTGSEDTFVYMFQNSGIVCLQFDESQKGGDSWSIKWTLNPRIE